MLQFVMYNSHMISWIKKHFIPHAGNDHRPHILRTKSIHNIILVVLLLEIFTFFIPAITRINNTGGMAAVLPGILADLTNNERQLDNLKTLTVSPVLNKAAEMKAQDMASKGYFAHTSPEGKTPWYWLEQAGYDYQYAGENLAVNFTDSQDVTSAWMNSPTHKANIVKSNYTEIGTGIAQGMYEGRQTIFVAQVYANPMPKPILQFSKKQSENIKTQIKTEVASINNNIIKTVDVKNVTNILGAEIDTQVTKSSTKEPTLIQKLFSSPRNSTNIVLLLIFSIIALSLALNIVIKIRHHHPDLITNGLATLAIIGVVIVSNYYISNGTMTTASTFEYSSQDK
jgi:Cysteine-rich secretory protein family